MIWLDASCKEQANFISDTAIEVAKDTLDYFAARRKPSIYEVAMANVIARKGISVKRDTIMDEDGNEYTVWRHEGTREILDIKDEDVTVFSLEEGITPYDMEVLLSNYL